MARVLVEYRAIVHGPTGQAFRARACGRPAVDGRWDGWVEFIDVVSGRVLRSPRETVQPNRVDVEYWASGLGAVYLEGCLHRALDPRSGTSSHRSPGSDRGP